MFSNERCPLNPQRSQNIATLSATPPRQQFSSKFSHQEPDHWETGQPSAWNANMCALVGLD